MKRCLRTGLTRWHEWRRRRAAQRQVSEAVHLMMAALRSGATWEQACHLVATQGPQPIAQAFAEMDQAVRLGMGLAERTQILRDRVGGWAVDYLVFAIEILHPLGGNLVTIAEQLLVLIEDEAHVRWRLRTASAQGLWSGALITAMPLLMIGGVAWCWPEWIAPLWQTSWGRACSVAALILDGVGWWWIARLVVIRP